MRRKTKKDEKKWSYLHVWSSINPAKSLTPSPYATRKGVWTPHSSHLMMSTEFMAGHSDDERNCFIVLHELEIFKDFARERLPISVVFRMPAPLAPYPMVSAPFTSPTNGAQSQLVCSGCQNLLLYPVGATSVCCAVCNAVTSVPPPGTEMAQLFCGGCHTLLMHIRGATSVKCSCCHTINLALEANQVAHVNCGNCRMLLMYQYGAPSVKCAVCNFVTSVLASANSTEQKFNS